MNGKKWILNRVKILELIGLSFVTGLFPHWYYSFRLSRMSPMYTYIYPFITYAIEHLPPNSTNKIFKVDEFDPMLPVNHFQAWLV